jgi:hypothetical protein
MAEEKLIDQFLMLSVNMAVTILHGDGADLRCAGVDVIIECSPKGSWELEGLCCPAHFLSRCAVDDCLP